MNRLRPVVTTVLSLLASHAIAQQPVFQSNIVNVSTPGHAVEIDADVTGAKELYLIVRDGGDGFSADWADWAEPRLVVAGGEVKLTTLKWKSASSDWGTVNLNRNAKGDALRIGGKPVEYGIGTHANSVIAFDLPAGSTRFKARGGIDNGGSDQGGGSSVQFFVFTQMPPKQYTQAGPSTSSVSRDPNDAVSNLDVAKGLEATLFASESTGLLSPADIDIDHLGRVWVCEVVNYRRRNGERKEGDRIVIVEDTNGDGISDKQTVFFQGREVDSALGICVLPTVTGRGTKVIVSCAPNIWIFTDEDGDLKADKKELLFTNTGDPQHDHSAHAFVFGPDGKLYWNFGNTGHRVCDKHGKPITDIDNHEVNDSGKPYRQGMAFRCNLDGTEFEVLGHNFRNNYELAVDSFGTVWQSDNDDDGNKGVRINYVMEGGNFGYTDEMTGAGWQSPRTNMETEIPLRHWHLNDPGVVPNLLQTGAGSPTGICYYEGALLPEVFRNQIIHCDAGPNVVRAYPAKKSGAGYSAEIVDLLVGTRDNWFRPSDACVAPDGSVIVADWYDPGVGGHAMGDVEKGRLFRVAPPKTPYKNPHYDFSTVDGAIEALKSPNLAARYLGWSTLHSMAAMYQDQVGSDLGKVFERDPNPRFRARALGVLAKSPGLRKKWLLTAINDNDPDIRIAALRLARQRLPKEEESGANSFVVELLSKLVKDPSVQVRRECALALKHLNDPKRPELWAALAIQHDGKDRWYLEALGIGADHHWDLCMSVAQAQVGSPPPTDLITHDSARDIIWRSRGLLTPQALALVLESNLVTESEAARYLRAFDFQTSPSKNAVLLKLAFGSFGDKSKTLLVNREAISRIEPFDITKNEDHRADMNRVLDGLKGQAQFVTLVDKFNVVERFPDLLKLAQAKPDDQISVDSTRVLLGKKQLDLFKSALSSREGNTAIATASALSNSGDAQAAELLLPLASNDALPTDLRREAIKGASRTRQGASELRKLAESGMYDEGLAPALSAALHGSVFEDVRAAAAKIFPLPPGKDSRPLPPLGELAKLKGNPNNGKVIFNTIGKCNTCHVINGEGKEVGPNLSEIGAKLSRQAMFESIIFPSAGISHNYESWIIELKNGTTQAGIIVSDDGKTISVKGPDAIVRTFAIDDIEQRTKQKISLMPADLAKLISQEEMVDVVEYLATLKTAKK